MKFVIPGDPIHQMRHRHRMVNGNVWAYDPQKNEKEFISQELIRQLNIAFNAEDKNSVLEASKLTNADYYEIEAHFFVQPPKHIPENLIHWQLIPCTNKKDLDNYLKLILDCGNGILYDDDHKINKATLKKSYSTEPKTVIYINPKKMMKLNQKTEAVLKHTSPSLLRELQIDAAKITQLDLPDSEENSTIYFRQLDASACTLLNFANKYAGLLKKLERIGERYANDNKAD